MIYRFVRDDSTTTVRSVRPARPSLVPACSYALAAYRSGAWLLALARRPGPTPCRASIVLLRGETARKASRVRCALFCERRLELTRHVAQVCEVRLHREGVSEGGGARAESVAARSGGICLQQMGCVRVGGRWRARVEAKEEVRRHLAGAHVAPRGAHLQPPLE